MESIVIAASTPIFADALSTTVSPTLTSPAMIARCACSRLGKKPASTSRVSSRAFFGFRPSLIRGVGSQQLFDRLQIFGRSPASLIFAKDDVLQFQQIVDRRPLVVGPVQFIRILGLETPGAAELRGAHLALPAIVIFLRPYVLTAHPARILH